MTDERRAFIHGLCRGGLYGYVVGGCVFAVLIAAFEPLRMWWFAALNFGCACFAWLILRRYDR